MRRTGLCASALVATLVSTLSSAAFAQDPTPQDPPPPAVARAEAQGTVDANAGARGGGAMTLPERGGRARAYAGDSDHEAVVGTLAIGYLGRRGLLVSESAGGTTEYLAPVIGVRYWFSPLLGLDAGLGMNINGESSEVTPGGELPGTSRSAFLLHGGVPLALAYSEHFVFQVVPEMNLGFGSYSVDDTPAGPGDSGSGFHLDLGARAGAEIHFGFIGLPKLSLQGTVGLAFATDSVKFEDGGGATTKTSFTSFATSVQDNPWNIFTSNVAALYYF